MTRSAPSRILRAALFNAGASSLLEHGVLGAAIASPLRKTQHRPFLPDLDDSGSVSESIVMEQTSNGGGVWFGGFYFVVHDLASASDMKVS